MARRRKSMRPGGGGRTQKLVSELKGRGNVRDPRAVAAAIGREKYGKGRFQKMAAKGRARAAGKRHRSRGSKRS